MFEAIDVKRNRGAGQAHNRREGRVGGVANQRYIKAARGGM
jgi:hypothetical protein